MPPMSDSTDQRPSKVPHLSSSDVSKEARPPVEASTIQSPPVESDESTTAPSQPQTISTSSSKRRYTWNPKDARNELLGEYVQKLQVPRWCIADLQLEELDIPGSEGQKKLSARKHYFNTIAPNFLKHPSIFYQTYNRKEIVEIAYKDAVYLLGVGGDDNLDSESPKLQEFRPKGEYLARFQSLSEFLFLQLTNPSINRTDVAYIVAKIETGAATSLDGLDNDQLVLNSEDYDSKALAAIVIRLKQDEDAWIMRRHIPQKAEGWNRKWFPKQKYEQPLNPGAGKLREPKPTARNIIPIAISRQSDSKTKRADGKEKDLMGDKGKENAGEGGQPSN